MRAALVAAVMTAAAAVAASDPGLNFVEGPLTTKEANIARFWSWAPEKMSIGGSSTETAVMRSGNGTGNAVGENRIEFVINIINLICKSWHSSYCLFCTSTL